MAGRICLEREPGAGSTFYFSSALDTADVVAPAAPDPQLAGLAVLIVDDNEVNRRILTEQTTRWKMRPTAVASGAEALDSMTAATRHGTPFLLVLLDANMPAMDGFGRAE